eukprot:931180-Rhodomonas_salina.1
MAPPRSAPAASLCRACAANGTANTCITQPQPALISSLVGVIQSTYQSVRRASRFAAVVPPDSGDMMLFLLNDANA